MMKWIAIAVCALFLLALWNAWPLLYAWTIGDKVERVLRLQRIGSRYLSRGNVKRAEAVFKMAVGECWESQPSDTPEMKRLASDVNASYALVIGKSEPLHPAIGLLARGAIARDPSNPFAHEILGMDLGVHNDSVGAMAEFNEGIRLAREAEPVDSEAIYRINKQILWIEENAAKIASVHRTAASE